MPRPSIERVIPVTHVMDVAHEFLESAGWQLEFDDGLCQIPKDTELRVASRAYVIEDLDGYTWGDHYQAKVLIGPEGEGGTPPRYGTLGLYFDPTGRMISEDRWTH